MKEIKITLKFLEWELIPVLKKPNYRTIGFRWLFIDFYLLKNKK